MVTTTGTTRATTTGSGWCASESDAAGPFSFRELWRAYEACRKRKRGTRDAQRYDQHLLDHLVETQAALAEGEWRPHRAQWFVSVRPKAREVHCAPFGDRVVHHWLVPRLEAVYAPVFIHDSHSNRPGHGTHYAVTRLQKHLRSVSANGRRPAWYLQLDIANFFNCIDRRLLYRLIRDRMAKVVARGQLAREQGRAILWLTGRILAQEPAQSARYIGHPDRRHRVPPHKRLSQAPPGVGLAIGNLPSQLFANIYLNELDHFVKHRLRCRGYVRYVDDCVLVHSDPAQLQRWRAEIVDFMADRLGLGLRDEGRLQRVGQGVDFLGYIVKPHYRLVRNRVVAHLDERLQRMKPAIVDEAPKGIGFNLTRANREAVRASLASSMGHFRHASAWRLTQRVFERHPWLHTLFRLRDGLGLQPRWQPLNVTRLRSQWRWFRAQWPEALILMQVGHDCEVYEADVECLDDYRMGPGSAAVSRPHFQRRAVIPLKRLRALRRRLRVLGLPHLFIAEEGLLAGGLKRRVLRLAWWPRQAPLNR